MSKAPDIFLSQRGGYLMILTSAMLGIFGLIAYIYYSYSHENIVQEISIFLFVSAGALVTTGAIIISADRLDLLNNSQRRGYLEAKIDYTNSKIDIVEQKLQKTLESKANQSQLEGIAEGVLRNKIENIIEKIAIDKVVELSKDKLISTLGDATLRERGFKIIGDKLEEYINGMHKELKDQRNAANLNLIWGIVFSILGLFTMGLFLIGPMIFPGYFNNEIHGQNGGWNAFLQSFIPKFTFVVIFESIGFFFLKSYAEDRNMIKYLRNEATNFESRSIAMLSTIHHGTEEHQDAIFRQMMATERNFTFKKGERLILEAVAAEKNILFEEIARKLTPNIQTLKDK